MSRSNPSEHTANPATRWFEWNGETGTVRYYDRDAKKNIDCGVDFGFVLLDELASVRGWHDASTSGIYSNEVRDTRDGLLIVKAFKGGTLAEGLYRDIKDRVNAAGGQFVANCYIGFKLGTDLVMGSLRFKGAALGAWMEFRKAHRGELYSKSVRIVGVTEGKKGRITFKTPVFRVVELTPETHEAAILLDRQLQDYLNGYLSQTKRDQADTVARHVTDQEVGNSDAGYEYDDADAPSPITVDDIPFAWLLPLVLPAFGLMGGVMWA